MRFICIDFETANNFNGSICAAGIAIIDDWEITDTKYWLVKPHSSCSYFDPFNISIHGITENDVEMSLEFDEVYKEIKPLLKGSVLVAHNASFDMSALRHVLELYDIPFPDVRYICTYKTALRIWSGLENYRLNTVCRHIDHEFEHHNAEADAIACGKVLISAMKAIKAQDINELSHTIGMQIGQLYDGGYSPCSIRKHRKIGS